MNTATSERISGAVICGINPVFVDVLLLRSMQAEGMLRLEIVRKGPGESE